jgi:predicted Zn-dependent protease
MTLRSLAPLAAVALACSGARPRLDQVSPPECLVEVLPRSAELSVDGVAVGPGARTLPIRDPARVLRLRATAAGFEPAELEVTGEKVAGARVGLALKPDGFGAWRTLDLDEPAGLASAGALLLRGGRADEAIQYASRAAELDPGAPLPHRVLGDAWMRLGQHERAADSYAAYLAHARPDAPDRSEVERRLGALRGDLELRGSAR